MDLLIHWSQEQKDEFLEMQFNAQHQYYQDEFQQASFELILLNANPIGRLYLDKRQDEYRIVDIALIPEMRNKGLGTRILNQIIREAHSMKLPVKIHVEYNNPALKLYKKLGFEKLEETGVYYLMECKAH